MLSHLRAADGWWERSSMSLADAYDYCEQVTRHYSKSFYFASAFLPEQKRRAIRALYAFCRYTDDIVDEPQERRSPASLPALPLSAQNGLRKHPRARGCTEEEARERRFERWAVLAHHHLNITHPVLAAWSDTYRRYDLPTEVVDELLAGVRMDLSISRYPTFDELWLYCYRVASTVGLLSMHIIGYEAGAPAEEYAIKLGVALQLTNILRDVGEDARRGRIYLPQDELAHFSLTEQDILDGRCDKPYRALMKYQIARTQQLYEEASPGIAMLHPDGRLAVAAAAQIYRAILSVIETNNYDNYTKRAFVPNWKKLAMLPRIWWEIRH